MGEPEERVKVEVSDHGRSIEIHNLNGGWNKDNFIFSMNRGEAWDLQIALKAALEEADEKWQEFTTKHQD